MSDQQTLSQLTLLSADSLAKTYRLPDAGRAWLESEAGSGGSFIAFYQSLIRDGLLSKTCPAFFPAMEDGTLPPSFTGWQNSGMACAGGFLTLNSLESPNGAAVCSLSQVLEADAAPKYFLSATAARGILRRAEKRGRELPHQLQQALAQLAE